jgi:hypothetical protein
VHPWRSSSWPWRCRATRRALGAPPPRFGATRRAPGAPPPQFGAPGHGAARRRSISGASPPQLPVLVLISGGLHLRSSATDETRPAAVPARRPWLPPPLSLLPQRLPPPLSLPPTGDQQGGWAPRLTWRVPFSLQTRQGWRPRDRTGWSSPLPRSLVRGGGGGGTGSLSRPVQFASADSLISVVVATTSAKR